ncbi:MAG: phytanoyl-CoA dioxygenase family protein [Deltaproteobacteria bacterium]|nr:phytanoyl-CoA dioxygenase family protein [Deltaproteobacteria bacterium]
MIDAAQQKQWDEDGYILIPGFAEPDVGRAMLERVVEISREAGGQIIHESYFVMPEQNLANTVDAGPEAEHRVSKIFRLHRDGPFQTFIESPRILDIGRSLLGPRIDCFLSQFIFKNPAAWGQPWHQDSFYFPFDRAPQVGFWLAVTEATLDNGCLWVLPGSHREPIHEHGPDRRPGANIGYVEIVDCDFSEERAVTMAAGDLLVFHSHLMHRSKDNRSDSLRAAMVYHMAEHGTKDRANPPTPVNDWMCLPDAAAVGAARGSEVSNEEA